eukprot:5003690-Prymnesium_polylepis.1
MPHHRAGQAAHRHKVASCRRAGQTTRGHAAHRTACPRAGGWCRTRRGAARQRASHCSEIHGRRTGPAPARHAHTTWPTWRPGEKVETHAHGGQPKAATSKLAKDT